MNAPHLTDASGTLAHPVRVAESLPSTVGRIIVIVPTLVEPALAASRIQQVAALRRQNVILIGAQTPMFSDALLRRNLVQLAGFLRHAGIEVDLSVERDLGRNPALAHGLQDDDLLACCVDDGVPSAGGHWIEALANRFHRPVYAFMVGTGSEPASPGLASTLASWLGSAALVAGFFWLQTVIAQRGADAINTLLLLVSVLVEIGAVALLNALLDGFAAPAHSQGRVRRSPRKGIR